MKRFGRNQAREWAGLAAVAVAGLLPRLVWVERVPTRPFSDFHDLVEFGVHLTRSWAARPSDWLQFNAGLPLLLSLILRVFHGNPAVVARYATAVATGVVPMIPYLVWRGVVSLRARLTAGLLLAVWPGQIFFSGVVAQDNWLLLPAVALGALAVRELASDERGFPVVSALLFGLSVAVRQEMLVALLPLALAAAGVFSGRSGLARRILAWTGLSALLLLALAGWRYAGSERFALSTSFSGISVLGTFVPGAGLDWTTPVPYVASVAPEVLEEDQGLARHAFRLTFREALRRPRFHAVRIFAASVKPLLWSDAGDLYWSLQADEALPASEHAWSLRFSTAVAPFLKDEALLALVLTAAAAWLAIRRRSWTILALLSFIVLKLAIHAILVSQQARYNVPVTAFEFLVIALGLDAAVSTSRHREALGAVAGSALVVGLWIFAGAKAQAWVLTHDEQITYRFTIFDPASPAELRCSMARGLLKDLKRDEAAIEFLRPDPAPGETVEAECRLVPAGATRPLDLEVEDTFSGGGFPGRIEQSVLLDGREAWSQDIAAQSGVGRSRIRLAIAGGTPPETIAVRLTAVRPDPGGNRGRTARTVFRLRSGSP